MAKKPAPAADDGIVLRWLGGPDPVMAIHGIPARDLTAYDLERIAYVRARNASLPQGDVADDLIRSGLYAPAHASIPEPVAPADPVQER